DVACGAADRLDQSGLRSEEALFVRVEDGYERHLGQVQTFSEKVDADQDVKLAQAQIPQNLDSLQRFDLRVEVAHLYADVHEVVGQVFSHLFGERRHQDPLAP